MDICIFYSWQSKYRNNCDNIINKALEKAVKELDSEQHDYHYVIKRGGGDVVGEEDITDNIDKIIQNEADIAIVDFTILVICLKRILTQVNGLKKSVCLMLVLLMNMESL